MPAALRVAGGLGVGAIFALRFCKAFREKLHPAPFLFDRAGSKGNRSPAADSAAGDQRQTSNFRHHVTVFHPSPLHALRRPPAAGRRCGRKRGRGQGRVEPLGGGKIFIFRLFWARANHPFRRPRFFHNRCVRQRVADGVSSSRRDSAAAIGFSAVFTYTTIPCPVVTGGGRYLHRYKFGPLWNESDRPLFSSATAYPLSACPDCRSFGSIRVAHRHGEPIGWARAGPCAHMAHRFSLSSRVACNRHPVAVPPAPQQLGVWAARSQSALPCGAVAGGGRNCGGGIPISAPPRCGAWPTSSSGAGG